MKKHKPLLFWTGLFIIGQLLIGIRNDLMLTGHLSPLWAIVFTALVFSIYLVPAALISWFILKLTFRLLKKQNPLEGKQAMRNVFILWLVLFLLIFLLPNFKTNNKASEVRVPPHEFTDEKNLLTTIKKQTATPEEITQYLDNPHLHWLTNDGYTILVLNVPSLTIRKEISGSQSLSDEINNLLKAQGFMKLNYGPSDYYQEQEKISEDGNHNIYTQYEKDIRKCLLIVHPYKNGDLSQTAILQCANNIDEAYNTFVPYIKAIRQYTLKKDPSSSLTSNSETTAIVTLKDDYFAFHFGPAEAYGKIVDNTPIILTTTQDILPCDFVDKEKIPVAIYHNCEIEGPGYNLRFSK